MKTFIQGNHRSTGAWHSSLKNVDKRYLLLLFVFLVIEISPRIGTFLADQLNGYFIFIDPDKVFSWSILHHIIQMMIPFVIMLIWSRRSLREWGFRMGDRKKGIKWILWFTIIWGGIYLALAMVNIVLHKLPASYYDLTNTRNLVGELSFRGLFVGISEETLFRAFPITILALYWNRKVNIFRFSVSTAGIIAAILFCYAHIGFNYHPFEIYHFNIIQLITAAGLGLFYAIVYEHTESILYPAIIHSISDVIPVLSLYLVYIIHG